MDWVEIIVAVVNFLIVGVGAALWTKIKKIGPFMQQLAEAFLAVQELLADDNVTKAEIDKAISEVRDVIALFK